MANEVVGKSEVVVMIVSLERLVSVERLIFHELM